MSDTHFDYAEDERAEVQRLIPAGPLSFLDVGCSSGGFGRGLLARHSGSRIAGVEASPASADRARHNGYDYVLEGFYPDVELSEKFDCIVFNDVLEHMADPWSAVAAARESVNPGGWVVASIPNIRYFPTVLALVRRDRWDYSDWGVLDRTHLRFFTQSTMVEMFQDAGFEIAGVHGINSAFNLAKWRRFRRATGRVGSAEWMQIVVIARPT